MVNIRNTIPNSAIWANWELFICEKSSKMIDKTNPVNIYPKIGEISIYLRSKFTIIEIAKVATIIVRRSMLIINL